MSRKVVQAVNFLLWLTKAREALSFRTILNFLTPLAGFRTNYWILVKPRLSSLRVRYIFADCLLMGSCASCHGGPTDPQKLDT